MSALWAPVGRDTAPEETLTEGLTRPSLRAVPGAAPRLARVPFILVLIGIFGLGMTGLLMLNTTLQNQAFQASSLNRQATELAYSQADLETQIDLLAAPQELARRASAYGLRANPYPAFLQLPKGKVVGKPTPVRGNEMPIMIVKTPAEIAADRAAAAAKAKAEAAQKVAEAKAKAAAEKAAAAKKVADAKAAAAKKAAAEKAAAKKPVSKKPVSKKPASKKPATKKSNGGRG